MKITSPDALAQEIKNARKRRKLTQQVVSDQIGVKQATISSFENHPERSRVETLFKLLSALDLELRVAKRGDTEQEAKWDQEW
ncbi:MULTISPECIES: helix-turn-helix domain-containing protein [Marinobacter]|uniref:Helix-turn-helix domain-containing protein n=1 Tax=Marinobacter metalliresistant TaxID=2961995 RepID=A0ABZ2W4Y3_9GAMM|nr:MULTISPECIES: helix-turn-helix domain-containing protein [Marinobacter]AXS82535.1 helix-turn-helix domain-containing protein [Marinobacter sp. Arc7-DN-1]